MKKANTYKGKLGWQSEFSHRYACWANNHNGWAKAKKSNKRLAKKVYLGRYAVKEEAILARLTKEVELYKEFSPQRGLLESLNL